MTKESWHKTLQAAFLMVSATLCITTVLMLGANNPSMDELVKGGISGPLVVLLLAALQGKLGKKD